MNYIADLYPQLRSADPLVNAKADAMTQFAWQDMWPKIPPKVWATGENRDAEIQAVIDEWMPKFFEKLVLFLTADKKFLTGDTVTIYDIQVAGLFPNLICNPNAKDAPKWAAHWEKAPERVKKYHADFCEDMKAYLDARPQDCTI